MANDKDIKRYLLTRELVLRECQESFWKFCKILHGYKESWDHLKILCNTLQQFFENKLINPNNNQPYSKIMINMPPRHFKSRSMILFCCWILGIDPDKTIITTSYSDYLATEFSRYTRDEITKTKNTALDIVYSDIFPDTKIKEGDASYGKWSLEGKHFTYLGAGFGASITGKGAKIGIIDDQIKSYEDAVNEDQLQKKWDWYRNTFISRFEEGIKEIIIMTRWTEKDICGRLLSDEIESKLWYVLKMEAYDQATDKMLCPDMLSKDSYLEKQRKLDDDVFQANYHQKTIDKKGALYQKYQTYDKLLVDEDGQLLQDRRICYIDTADEGNDYLVAICGIEYNKQFYLLDLICSQLPQEQTEDMVCNMLIDNAIKDVLIESNNGGRAFARNVDRKLKERGHYEIRITWFHQSENKLARILSNASNVENRVFYPVGWNYKYPEYNKLIKAFMRNKNNKVDDPEDAITGIIEMIDRKQNVIAMPSYSAGSLGL